MDKNDLAALLDALCERPLREEQRALSAAEWLALRRALAQAAPEDGEAAGATAEPIEARDRLTAALASVLSGSGDEAARRALAETALRSSEVRLDAQSAFAFVDAVEQSTQAAPAHLLEQIIAADTAPAARPAALFDEAGRRTLWSLLAGGAWSARRWGAAAACAVLLAAGGLSWSVYRQSSSIAPVAAPPPLAETAVKPPAMADAPAPPKPALATARRPCEPPLMKNEQSAAQPLRVAPAVDAEKRAGDVGCDADENEAVAARARLDAARQAAAERAAAEAAARLGAAQSGGAERGPAAAARTRPPVGAPAREVPAAAATAPASPSHYGVAPPAAAPAMRPSGAAR